MIPMEKARTAEEVHELFGKRFQDKDLDGLVALYEPKAIIAPQADQIIGGHEGIRLLSSTVPRVRRLSRLATKLSGRTLITPARLKNLLGKEKLLGWTLRKIDPAAPSLPDPLVKRCLRRERI